MLPPWESLPERRSVPVRASGRDEPWLQAGAQQLIATMESQLDERFERMVQAGLRHLPEYDWLGHSDLAEELLVEGVNQIERGKAVRQAILAAIESLRPAGARPAGTQCIPREWYLYVIMYDAYIEEISNREIMARLYISEGTFNRRRREALRAVAHALLEAKRETLAAHGGSGQPRPESPSPADSLAGWLLRQGGRC